MLKPMTLSQLVAPLAGRHVGADASFSGVSIDSRTVGPDSCSSLWPGRVSMVTTIWLTSRPRVPWLRWWSAKWKASTCHSWWLPTAGSPWASSVP